jgi:outer membrane biosynthesis protein TonB
MELINKVRSSQYIQTVGIALFLEVVILYLAFWAIAGNWRNHSEIVQDAIELVLNQEQKIEKPPELPKPKVVPVVKNNVPKEVRQEVLPVTNQPSENVVKEIAPSPPSPRVETPPQLDNPINKPDPMAVYRGQVNAAIQAATTCSSAAKDMNLKGKTRVQFNLLDSIQSSAKVVTSSGIPMLDNMALNAVQNARYPKPPAEFIGQMKPMLVLVNLNCGD